MAKNQEELKKETDEDAPVPQPVEVLKEQVKPPLIVQGYSRVSRNFRNKNEK